MKKKLLSVSLLFTCVLSALSAQTATEFVSTDCSGTNHDLFADLDAGKVVILTWVMPCGGCIGPANQAFTTANNYSSSNPGRVEFWLADDYGNLDCASLTNWAFTNGITHVPIFSDSNIRMSDYGPYGMPKTVVLGGADHHVFYVYDAGQDTAAFIAAIDSALLASTVVPVIPPAEIPVDIFPNPAASTSTVSCFLSSPGNVRMEIIDISGKIVQ
ncbi:MAG TPA: hypothetical protein VL651_11570, partial [Bacteroidia bacterium]|nr:hypothetical protein [Bacteroidia bacterium]